MLMSLEIRRNNCLVTLSKEEVSHVRPLDSFPLVLLLLLLQDELDEELLQLLVAVIDAELLEAGRERRPDVLFFENSLF